MGRLLIGPRGRAPTRARRLLLAATLTLAAAAGCADRSDTPNVPAQPFVILASSENQPLEPIIQEYAEREDVDVQLTYRGSVDIMRDLSNGAVSGYDAVWPAHSIWLQLGDTSDSIQHASSIMRSPVVFGVKRSVAERLGWVGAEVTVDDIAAAVEAGALRLAMTDAAQSDSGAAAYLGFLYAFAGHPEVLSAGHLQAPAVRDRLARIFAQVDHSAAGSGWLTEQFLTSYDAYDAMVNYESAVIEANQALVESGREPLYAIYPVEGTVIADWPLAYVDKDDAGKEALFQGLQAHLLSDEVQDRLLALGRRTGFGFNLDPATIDADVFNPAWGIDTERIVTAIKFPEASVLDAALDLYRTTLDEPATAVPPPVRESPGARS